MKRSPMPRRRTRLRPGKPLARRTPLRARRQSGRARPNEPLATWCELAIPDVCLGRATNRHHVQRRGQLGSDDRDNTLDLCGSGTTGCHGYVHAHPAESIERGWLRRPA